MLAILGNFKPRMLVIRAFWILVDFVWNVNRVIPEMQFPQYLAWFSDGEDWEQTSADYREVDSEAAAAERARKTERTRELNFSGCSCSGIIRQ